MVDDIVKCKLWRPSVLFKEQAVENKEMQFDKDPFKNKSIMSYF